MIQIETLRKKWGQIPFGNKRSHTKKLLELSDNELLDTWLKADTEASKARQWYREAYVDMLRGKKVLDVGCGLAFDSIYFANHGADLTFADIVPENLELVKRIIDIEGLSADYLYIGNLDSLKTLGKYDVIMALGSLHHAPQDIIAPEIAELTKHLKTGGRWLQLAYPKCRWEKQGRLPFSIWGRWTDGIRTPWAEWYDVEKLMALLNGKYEERFTLLYYHEFHNNEFNWFDLVKNAT